MTRNTERRIEIACPVLDIKLKQRVYEMLETMLLDNTKAWEMFADGRYVLRRAPKDLVINSQEMFIEQARIRHDRAAFVSAPGKRTEQARIQHVRAAFVSSLRKRNERLADFRSKFSNVIYKVTSLFKKHKA